MTIDKHEVKDTIQQYCSIPPIRLDDLLSVLNAEQLEELKWIVEDAYDAGQEDIDSEYRRGYDAGWEAGFAEG